MLRIASSSLQRLSAIAVTRPVGGSVAAIDYAGLRACLTDIAQVSRRLTQIDPIDARSLWKSKARWFSEAPATRPWKVNEATIKSRHPLVTAVVVAFPIVTAGLGLWQLQRSNEKKELLDAIESKIHDDPIHVARLPDAPEQFTRVRLEGTYRNDDAILVGPRPRLVKGTAKVGSLLVVPMEVDGGGVLLVNRGWVPVYMSKNIKEDVKAWEIHGAVCEEGIVRGSETPSRSLGPINEAASGTWTWLDVPAIAASAGLPPDTPMVDVVSETGDQRLKKAPIHRMKVAAGLHGEAEEVYPLPRAPESYLRQYLMPEDHVGYAVTWFTMSAVTAVMARRLLKGLPFLP